MHQLADDALRLRFHLRIVLLVVDEVLVARGDRGELVEAGVLRPARHRHQFARADEARHVLERRKAVVGVPRRHFLEISMIADDKRNLNIKCARTVTEQQIVEAVPLFAHLQHRAHQPTAIVAEAGCDKTGMQGVGGNAAAHETPGQFTVEQDVAQLGFGIDRKAGIAALVLKIAEIQPGAAMGVGRRHHDAAAVRDVGQ